MTDEIARIDISGEHGAGTAAAVVAVIAEVLHGEALQRAAPPRRPRPSPWVAASQPRELPTPLPSESFEGVQWHDRRGESPVGDTTED